MKGGLTTCFDRLCALQQTLNPHDGHALTGRRAGRGRFATHSQGVAQFVVWSTGPALGAQVRPRSHSTRATDVREWCQRDDARGGKWWRRPRRL